MRAEIRALEARRKSRVIVVAASWREGVTHDLDLDGARAFLDVFDSLDTPDLVSLVIVARGGTPGFADQVIRTVGASGVRLEVVVPTYCNGVATLLGLYASTVVLYRHGGLGAYDSGPLSAENVRLDHDLVEYVPALGGLDVSTAAATMLATGNRQRMLARELARRVCKSDEAFEALSQYGLGKSLGLGTAQLSSVGVDAVLDDSPEIWDLFGAVERELSLRDRPSPRYTESDLGDEVEFEPASGMTTALIESASAGFRFVVDTGRPDPDTGTFRGAWEEQPRPRDVSVEEE